jgi:hypothetical protein
MALQKTNDSETGNRGVQDRKRRRRGDQSKMRLTTLAIMIAVYVGRLVVPAAAHQAHQGQDRHDARPLLRKQDNSRILSNLLEKRTAANDFRGPELVKQGAGQEYNIMGHNYQASGIGREQFQYCYDTLASVAVDGKVCYEQYCEFLDLLSGGEVSNCNNLDSCWVLLFYSTACDHDEDCSKEKAYISIKDEGLNSWSLYQLCEEAMSNTFTRVDVSFEFSIQYNSTLLDKNEIAACVSDATENLLYDSLGCMDDTRRQLSELQSESRTAGLQISHQAPQLAARTRAGRDGDTDPDDRRRAALLQEAFGTPDEWTRENCPFSVTTEVVVVDIGTKHERPPYAPCNVHLSHDAGLTAIQFAPTFCRPRRQTRRSVVLSSQPLR